MLSHTLNGAAIRAARERRGLSVRDLAERTGITADYVYKLETGRKQPGTKLSHRLATVLDVPFTDLTAEAAGARS